MAIENKIILGFFILILVFIGVTFKIAKKDEVNWVANTATYSKVVDIYGGYKGKPRYQIMQLSDSQRLTIPENVLGKLSIGDSVFKEKGDEFYRFKLMKT